jgi:WD40 repeat protein
MPDPEESGNHAHLHLIAFSPDGKYVAAYAGDDIQLWECATGKKAKSYPSVSDYLQCLAFSGDGRNVVGMGAGAIVVWDIATDRLLGHPGGKIETHKDLCFFPDGRRAYTSSSKIQSASLDRATPGLEQETVIWEVATGKRLGAASLSPVGHSPDGKYLLTGASDPWPKDRLLGRGTNPIYFTKHEDPADTPASQTDKALALVLVDTEAGKVLHRFPSGDALFGNHGRSLAICSGGGVQIFDCATGKVVRKRRLDSSLWCLWGSADLSHFLVQDQETVRLLDIAQGKELWRRPLPCTGFTSARKNLDALEPPTPAIISAGERICTVVFPSRIEAWDMDTGMDLWRRPAPVESETMFGSQFSPDGKRVCLKGPKDAVVVDLASGDEFYRIPWRDHGNIPWVAAFLRDNLLYVADGDRVGLWRSNGRLLWRFDYSGDPSELAASADGKLLASPAEDGKVSVWEIATGLLMQTFESPEKARSISFSPDGKTLVTRGNQLTLTWDLSGIKLSSLNRPVPLAADDFEKCWRDLGEFDGVRFHRAFWRMVADPQQTVTRLGCSLQPVHPMNAKTIEQLVEDLGSDSFTLRESATKVLETSDSAVALLYKRLKEGPSLEEKKRIELILKNPPTLGRTASNLRSYRSVQILEQIGTREAVDLLRRWAKGPPDTILTEQARASLERMVR